MEEGERSTQYFLGLEKSRQKSNTIRSLKSGDLVVTSDDELLELAANFYDELYKSRNVSNTSISQYLESVTINRKLAEYEKQSIEGKITHSECEKALKLLKLNKSPGLDGIPSEFYVKFWNIIGSTVIASYNESYDEGQLSDTQRSAVITLI